MDNKKLLWIILLLILIIGGCRSTEVYVPWWADNAIRDK